MKQNSSRLFSILFGFLLFALVSQNSKADVAQGRNVYLTFVHELSISETPEAFKANWLRELVDFENGTNIEQLTDLLDFILEEEDSSQFAHLAIDVQSHSFLQDAGKKIEHYAPHFIDELIRKVQADRFAGGIRLQLNYFLGHLGLYQLIPSLVEHVVSNRNKPKRWVDAASSIWTIQNIGGVRGWKALKKLKQMKTRSSFLKSNLQEALEMLENNLTASNCSAILSKRDKNHDSTHP